MSHSSLRDVKRQLSGKHVFYFKLLEPFPEVTYLSGVDCGFFALNIVMEYRNHKFGDPRGTLTKLKPFVQPASVAGVHPLRNMQMQGSFVLGGGSYDQFWTPLQIKKTAFEQGYHHTEICEELSFDNISQIIKKGYAPMVAIDVDAKGNPGAYSGTNAHWAVLLGFGSHKDGEQFVVATHSWGGFYIWPLTALKQSNAQLIQIPQAVQSAAQVANGSHTAATIPGVSLSGVRNKILVLRRIAGIY